jgi:hypothetical protein
VGAEKVNILPDFGEDVGGLFFQMDIHGGHDQRMFETERIPD